MSNISTVINFLKENAKLHFLIITNQDTGQSVGKSKIYLDDIPHEDLKSYIKLQLGQINKPTLVWVELRRDNGTSTQKKGSCAIEVHPDFATEPQQPMNNLPVTHITSEPPFHQASPMLGNSMQQFGLGFHEVMKMNTDSAMLLEVRKQLEDSKEEIKQLKHDNRKLDIELIDQKTKVATAEQQKELAVMIATASQKGFFDGEGFQKLLEKAPDMLEKFAAIKAGNVPEVSTLGNPDLSAVKKEFIDYVIENLNDNQVSGLTGICMNLSKAGFFEKLTELLKEFESQ